MTLIQAMLDSWVHVKDQVAKFDDDMVTLVEAVLHKCITCMTATCKEVLDVESARQAVECLVALRPLSEALWGLVV